MPPPDSTPADLLSFKLQHINLSTCNVNKGGCLHLRWIIWMSLLSMIAYSGVTAIVFIFWLCRSANPQLSRSRSTWRWCFDLYHTFAVITNLFCYYGGMMNHCESGFILPQPIVLIIYLVIKALRCTYFEREFRLYWDPVEIVGTVFFIWIFCLLYRWSRYFEMKAPYIKTMTLPPWTDGSVRRQIEKMSAANPQMNAQQNGIEMQVIRPMNEHQNNQILQSLPAEGISNEINA